MPQARKPATAVIDLGDFANTEHSVATERFAMRKVAGHSLLSRIARRLSECVHVQRVFIAGADIPANIMEIGLAGVDLLNLPSSHVFERLCEAADSSDAGWVVYVPGNRPFIDPTLTDQMLAKAVGANNCDYVGYKKTESSNGSMDQLGLTGEAICADTLRRLRRNIDRLNKAQNCLQLATGTLATWLLSAPGAYHLKFIPLPDLLDQSELRFAIETEADWDHAELLWNTMPGSDFQWQDLMQLVLSNSRIQKSMIDRNA